MGKEWHGATLKKCNTCSGYYTVKECPVCVRTITKIACQMALPALPNRTWKEKDADQVNTTLPHTKSQRVTKAALGSPIQGKAESLSSIEGRIRVKFIGYRVRPLDPDNFAGSTKNLLDGLRHAGLIHGDEPWKIIFETEQFRVKTFKEEKTEIIIDYPTNHTTLTPT